MELCLSDLLSSLSKSVLFSQMYAQQRLVYLKLETSILSVRACVCVWAYSLKRILMRNWIIQSGDVAKTDKQLNHFHLIRIYS